MFYLRGYTLCLAWIKDFKKLKIINIQSIYELLISIPRGYSSTPHDKADECVENKDMSKMLFQGHSKVSSKKKKD